VEEYTPPPPALRGAVMTIIALLEENAELSNCIELRTIYVPEVVGKVLVEKETPMEQYPFTFPLAGR
ncbi:hypothetical protein ACSLVQ_28860, partial [Klebsiella pneumoniae]|uniref:hypothetical protein n=1 Tax=Klebsiella pneumoniae TaxID=573 RepID=UPI003EE07176